MQIVVLVDAKLVNIALGSKEGLNKGIEPDGSDKMISVSGHRTLFSADTNSRYWRLIRKGTTAAFQYKNIRLTMWLIIRHCIILTTYPDGNAKTLHRVSRVQYRGIAVIITFQTTHDVHTEESLLRNYSGFITEALLFLHARKYCLVLQMIFKAEALSAGMHTLASCRRFKRLWTASISWDLRQTSTSTMLQCDLPWT